MALEGGAGARGRSIWWIVGLLMCSALGITRCGLLPFPAGGWVFAPPQRAELRSGSCVDLSTSPGPVAPVASAASLVTNIPHPVASAKPLLVTTAAASSVRGSLDTVLVAARVLCLAVILGGVVVACASVSTLRTTLAGATVAVEVVVVASSVHFSSML